MTEWIRVEDRLPPEDKMVIGYIPDDRHMFVGFYKTYKHSWMEAPIGYWLILTANGSTEQITKKVSHWMPLPKGVENETN